MMQENTPRPNAPRRINLALQGGGSHGALTWGVLDRLLADPRLEICEISGTSAGAMNAVVLADGYVQGGREGARAALERFWMAVSDAARFSPIQRSPFDQWFGRYTLDHSPGYIWFDIATRLFSPYDLNPAGFNPLRRLLADTVDFDNVRASREIAVHVAATNVRTGRSRVFSREAVTLDAVMGSACLPQLFPAVEIDGEFYWDGGYSGNPELLPLVESARTADIVIVQINPLLRREPPRRAREIINRINEISFNTSLIKDLRAIALTQRLNRAEGSDCGMAETTYLHLIHTEADVQDLSASSKLNPEWAYLKLLFERGERWADEWLDRNFDALGQRSTLDLDDLFRDVPRSATMKPLEE